MLKLKSASEHYEETKTSLQKMVESIDKVSQTNQKLAENMSLAVAELEKTNLENKKTQEFIQKLYDEAKHVFEAEAQRHEASLKDSLNEKFNEISDGIRKQTDKILQSNDSQSKSLRLLKALAIVGIVLEAVIIIRMLLF